MTYQVVLLCDAVMPGSKTAVARMATQDCESYTEKVPPTVLATSLDSVRRQLTALAREQGWEQGTGPKRFTWICPGCVIAGRGPP